MTAAQEDIMELQADVAAAQTQLGTADSRLTALEATKQLFLSNGPLPPGPVEQIMTLFAPETDAIDKVQINYGWFSRSAGRLLDAQRQDR